MQEKRKDIIRFALGHNIDNINTYSGYKGDLVLKISSRDVESIAAIQRYAARVKLVDLVVKNNPNLGIFELYCVTEDEQVYDLKS